MIRVSEGSVRSILYRGHGVTEMEVEVDGGLALAVNYDLVTGPVRPGDRVVLNTTAVTEGLGSGGFHFVMFVHGTTVKLPSHSGASTAREPGTGDAGQDGQRPGSGHAAGHRPGSGHIMKLRYTPWQIKVLSVEEEESPHRDRILSFTSLSGQPVIIGSLHSVLAPAAVAFKLAAGKAARVVYLMTDGGALPLGFSKSVRSLRERGYIDATVTAGHAFGGDLEAVTLHSGLVAAHSVAAADLTIVAMGPGVVGTASPFGTTALEQGQAVDAVNCLGGRPIAVPRVSFRDSRSRHRGISHHTVTALGRIAQTRAVVPLPQLPEPRRSLLQEALSASGLAARHDIVFESADSVLDVLEREQVPASTMGRGPAEDREFFLTAAAAGMVAARLHTAMRTS
ncbi:MAG: DUF3866 family protein [Firmicutes bacterium]|nr:DUF3866 family protein [Bacillota bacterium]